MNRTSIGWVPCPRWTWNAITGCSQIGCPLAEDCYAYGMSLRLAGRYGYPEDEPFRPTFHVNRLREPYEIKKPSYIFVSSMGEFWDRGVKPGWRARVMDVVWENPRHTFLFLTKQSHMLIETNFPPNVWLGVTVNRLVDLYRIEHLRATNALVRFISCEPLLEDLTQDLTKHIDLSGVHQVIIGGRTGRRPFDPPAEWVHRLEVYAQEQGCAIFEKDNLGYEVLVQEFPETGGNEEQERSLIQEVGP